MTTRNVLFGTLLLAICALVASGDEASTKTKSAAPAKAAGGKEDHAAMPCGQNNQPHGKFFGQSSFDGTNDRELGRLWPKEARNHAGSATMSVGFSTFAHSVNQAVILRQYNP